MQAFYKKQGGINPACFLNYFIGLVLIIVSSVCFADPIIITGNQVISKPTVYKNAVLDMTNGRFTINSNGSLKIENSTINSTISQGNPFFVYLSKGNLNLSKNTFNVTVNGITPDSNTKSAYQYIQVEQGNVNIENNTFTNDTFYTLGFFETKNLTTNGLNINNNSIKGFHGGIYLTNSNFAMLSQNTFENVSFANIYHTGRGTQIVKNLFSFPGNLMLGDAIDIINASDDVISDNIIASSSGYGILVMGGHNLAIEHNKITDGLSYAITIQTPSISEMRKNKYLSQFIPKQNVKWMSNSLIILDKNYLAQNRYGLTGGVMDNVIVSNNIFIQRFSDSSTRQFWTNNDILLPLATNMLWMNNQYKEAFTQEVPGDNSNTLQFVPFPKRGGVILP